MNTVVVGIKLTFDGPSIQTFIRHLIKIVLELHSTLLRDTMINHICSCAGGECLYVRYLVAENIILGELGRPEESVSLSCSRVGKSEH
jgi:hypothetical protein